MPNAINFWLPINKEDWDSQVNDLLSEGPVQVPCGCAMQFNFCFTPGAFNDGDLLDLSNYSQIVFQILKPDLSAALISQSIDAGSFQVCTTEEFEAFTAQQIQVFIPSAANVLTTTSGAPGNFILQVYGVDADAAEDIDILCCFRINAIATGVTLNPGSPIPLNWGSYIPFFCSDGNTRNLSLVKLPTGQWDTEIGDPYQGPGMNFVAIKCADGLFRNLSLVQDSGNWTTDINPNGYS